MNISINTLIPKPHTPLQWFKMEDMDSVLRKQRYLKERARNRKLELSFHDHRMSFLEGVLARGDRRLGSVILNAYKNGARFDAWSASFSFEKWLSAFQEAGIDPCLYLKGRSSDELLPWDFIDTGIEKDALVSEFKLAPL